jgi:hypothetical protein
MRARQRHFSYRAAGASLAIDTRYIHGVSNNTSLQTLNDLSGNGRNATQATIANRATYLTSIQGGNGILRFDGTDRYNAAFITGTAYSLYCIFKRTGSNTNPFSNATFVASAGISNSTATTSRRYQLFYNGSASGNFGVSSNASVSVFHSRDNNWNLHSVSAAIGSGNKLYYLNGGNAVSGNVSGLSGVTTGNVRMTIGATSWDNNYPFNGDLGLLVTYETAHSAPIRKRLEHSAAISFKISCN